MGVKEIESAVAALDPQDLAEFSHWFEKYVADQWDRQIEEDVHAGRLDAAGRKADAEFEAGRCTPL